MTAETLDPFDVLCVPDDHLLILPPTHEVLAVRTERQGEHFVRMGIDGGGFAFPLIRLACLWGWWALFRNSRESAGGEEVPFDDGAVFGRGEEGATVFGDDGGCYG